MSAADFTRVVVALDEYTSDTGRLPLALGGWEAEDPAIVPPPSLVDAIIADFCPAPPVYLYA